MKPDQFNEYELKVIIAALRAANAFCSYMIKEEVLERRKIAWQELEFHILDILKKINLYY